jgi:hypothetical protein
MKFCRVIMSMACLAAAGTAEASTAPVARLPLSLGALGTGPEIAYHPNRWLTIRRSIAFAQPGAFHEEPVAAPPLAPLRKADALTGDIHPFGDALRLSLGLREDQNHRLLRMSNDAAATGTARYRPMVAVGLAGQVAPGFAMAVDVGLLGRSFAYDGVEELVTPIEQGRATGRDRVGLLVQLSAGYQF